MSDILPAAEAVNLFKCLSDRSRYDIVATLAEGESYPELISKRLGITPATVCFHLKKLEAAGFVSSRRDQFYIIYSIVPGALDRSLSELVRLEGGADAQRERDYEAEVERAFIKYGKLVSIPVQLKKREIIMRRLVSVFDFGRDYTEREVNLAISEYHDDFCTIRREMVTMGLLTRDHEIYRRLK